MILRKGLKRNLLLFLALIDDLYGEISYREFRKQLALGEAYEKPKSFYSLVYRMAKVGEIEKEIVKGEPVLKITTKGLKLLNETVPLRWLAKRRWDGRWRMVIFDIPEKQRVLRDAVRHKLLSLGFGKWQRSVYITPHDLMREIQDFLEAKKLFPACVCLTARRKDFGDDQALARRVFKLDKINGQYRVLSEEFEALRWQVEKGKKKKINKRFGRLWEDYQDLLMADPHLPAELLPEVWWAEEARQEFKKLVKAVWGRGGI